MASPAVAPGSVGVPLVLGAWGVHWKWEGSGAALCPGHLSALGSWSSEEYAMTGAKQIQTENGLSGACCLAPGLACRAIPHQAGSRQARVLSPAPLTGAGPMTAAAVLPFPWPGSRHDRMADPVPSPHLPRARCPRLCHSPVASQRGTSGGLGSIESAEIGLPFFLRADRKPEEWDPGDTSVSHPQPLDDLGVRLALPQLSALLRRIVDLLWLNPYLG